MADDPRPVTGTPTPISQAHTDVGFWLFVIGQIANGCIALDMFAQGSVGAKLCSLVILVAGAVATKLAMNKVKPA